jgi:hypothetical protein
MSEAEVRVRGGEERFVGGMPPASSMTLVPRRIHTILVSAAPCWATTTSANWNSAICAASGRFSSRMLTAPG